ncbi:MULTISPECIES: sensor histidine kinase [unclassified Lentimonas]|uniref:sensor histidine kinase n=1 Tax=unclassified Lentimonas TaxID=2630993 RepID=UPI001324D101|nr:MULTISPECIES: histidine kinase [unclassified Lentimonas]CAA6692188.1 Unannotated [Lentimonas sp. CC19]CAA6697037.1 Unannotated [Lentimonas sp. CC10]
MNNNEVTWEEAASLKLSPTFKKNSERLLEIEQTLSQLPTPYMGVPTGSGGYLSDRADSPDTKIQINFQWDSEHLIDALALIPLRLYLGGEGELVNNAYWPGSIKIIAKQENSWVELARVVDSQKTFQGSLPELIRFTPIQTNQIRIVCTKLSKRVNEPDYRVSLSEIFVFSGQANIAPLASKISPNGRGVHRIFSVDHLTDLQTPLGLPELGPRTSDNLGVAYVLKEKSQQSAVPSKPIQCVITFEESLLLDAVRVDPVRIFKAGQAFPIRFSIELLDEEDQVIQTHDTYKSYRFRNPGLNPYIAYFNEAQVRSIRLNIFELSKPTFKSRPNILLSEMSPMLRGQPLSVPADLSRSTKTKPYTTELVDPKGFTLFWSLEGLYDGMTQSGSILSHRTWLEGLDQRQKLLEERLELTARQAGIAQSVRNSILSIIIFIALAAITTAIIAIIRSQLRTRQAIREERERIAMDLHDETGSNLAAIAQRAQLLIAKEKDHHKSNSLQAVLRLSKESTFGLREVLYASAPHIGRPQNILTYMQELAELILITPQFTFDSAEYDHSVGLSPKIRKDVMLFYKEALNNCQKHSSCNEVKVTLSNTMHQLQLSIQDNGTGLSQEALQEPSALRTLKQRAKHLKGSLDIQSSEPLGLRLILKIPL